MMDRTGSALLCVETHNMIEYHALLALQLANLTSFAVKKQVSQHEAEHNMLLQATASIAM